MYIISSETDHQPRLDAWDKCSGLVHWEDPEGSGGEGGGRGDRDGEYMYIQGWFMSMYDKNHLKKKKDFIKIKTKTKHKRGSLTTHKKLKDSYRLEQSMFKYP